MDSISLPCEETTRQHAWKQDGHQEKEMEGGGGAQLTPCGFKVDYDKSGRARCKQCKVLIDRFDLRMGKHVFFI